MSRAACRGKGDLFFDDMKKLQVAQAKKICAACPVLAECRAHALENEEYGVWGGLTANQRREVRLGRLKVEAVVVK
jgi:WhiB family redox-sensing transcriptional regulator